MRRTKARGGEEGNETSKGTHGDQFIVFFERAPFAILIQGHTATHAVENYYLQTNAFCAGMFPLNYQDEYLVTTCRLPLDLSKDLIKYLDEMDLTLCADAAWQLGREHNGLIYSTIKVVVKNGRMNFTLPD